MVKDDKSAVNMVFGMRCVNAIIPQYNLRASLRIFNGLPGDFWINGKQ
jgi:hypothetical protein